MSVCVRKLWMRWNFFSRCVLAVCVRLLSQINTHTHTKYIISFGSAAISFFLLVLEEFAPWECVFCTILYCEFVWTLVSPNRPTILHLLLFFVFFGWCVCQTVFNCELHIILFCFFFRGISFVPCAICLADTRFPAAILLLSLLLDHDAYVCVYGI